MLRPRQVRSKIRSSPDCALNTLPAMARCLLCALAVLALASGQPLDLGFCRTACRQAAPQEACERFVQQCQTAEAVKNPIVQSLCETWAVTMKEGCGESMAQGFPIAWFIHADHHQGLACCLPAHATMLRPKLQIVQPSRPTCCAMYAAPLEASVCSAVRANNPLLPVFVRLFMLCSQLVTDDHCPGHIAEAAPQPSLLSSMGAVRR